MNTRLPCFPASARVRDLAWGCMHGSPYGRNSNVSRHRSCQPRVRVGGSVGPPTLCRTTPPMPQLRSPFLPRTQLLPSIRRSVLFGSGCARQTCPATNTVWRTALAMLACMLAPFCATSTCCLHLQHIAAMVHATSSLRLSLMPLLPAPRWHLQPRGFATCLLPSPASLPHLCTPRCCLLTIPPSGRQGPSPCSSFGPTCACHSWPACGGCAASAPSPMPALMHRQSRGVSSQHSAPPSCVTGPESHAT